MGPLVQSDNHRPVYILSIVRPSEAQRCGSSRTCPKPSPWQLVNIYYFDVQAKGRRPSKIIVIGPRSDNVKHTKQSSQTTPTLLKFLNKPRAETTIRTAQSPTIRTRWTSEWVTSTGDVIGSSYYDVIDFASVAKRRGRVAWQQTQYQWRLYNKSTQYNKSAHHVTSRSFSFIECCTTQQAVIPLNKYMLNIWPFRNIF